MVPRATSGTQEGLANQTQHLILLVKLDLAAWKTMTVMGFVHTLFMYRIRLLADVHHTAERSNFAEAVTGQACRMLAPR